MMAAASFFLLSLFQFFGSMVAICADSTHVICSTNVFFSFMWSTNHPECAFI